MKGYNGWKNRSTWNVALWIGNDEGMYTHAKGFAKLGYEALARDLKDIGIIETPDNVSYSDPTLDIKALDSMLKDL